MNCCGIFYGPQEESVNKGEIRCDLSLLGKVSGLLDVQGLWHFSERILRLYPQTAPSGPKPGDYRPDYPAAEAMQKHIRLSADAVLAGQKRLSQES